MFELDLETGILDLHLILAFDQGPILINHSLENQKFQLLIPEISHLTVNLIGNLIGNSLLWLHTCRNVGPDFSSVKIKTEQLQKPQESKWICRKK